MSVLSRLGLQASLTSKQAKQRSRPGRSKTAPPVHFSFGQSQFLTVTLVALWSLGAAITHYMLWTKPVHSYYHGIAGCCLLIGAAAAYWGWSRTQKGLLQWDGAGWWVGLPDGHGAPPRMLVYSLTVQFDFQFFLLLRLDFAASGSQWLWLDSWSQAGNWRALRRAVFSPKPPPGVLVSTFGSTEPLFMPGHKR